MINAKTKLCCLLGNPVGHSMSPVIHNRAFAELGLNFAYLAFAVDDPAAAIAGIRGLGIRGASVTIPHKVAVMPLLDEIEDIAGAIGAVNTIVNDDGKLTGYNFDGLGAFNAIVESGFDPAGKTITAIGSGGAARAILFTIISKGAPARVNLFGVVETELAALAEGLAGLKVCQVVPDNVDSAGFKTAIENADLVINGSPVGMSPDHDKTPAPGEWLSKGQTVFDAVYNPLQTRLLREAAEAGCTTVQGVEMFVNQAIAQFEIFTGEKAPAKVMRDTVLKALGE